MSITFQFGRVFVTVRPEERAKHASRRVNACLQVLLSIGLMTVLAGCTATLSSDYTRTVSHWRGKNVHTLIQERGLPSQRIQQADGTTVYIYKSSRYHSYGAPASPMVGVHVTPDGKPIILTRPRTNHVDPREPVLTCVTTFVVDHEGIIVRVRREGC